MFTSYTWDERDRIFKRLNKLLPKRIVVSMHAEFHGSTTNGVSCMGVTKHTKKLCCLNFLFFTLGVNGDKIHRKMRKTF